MTFELNYYENENIIVEIMNDDFTLKEDLPVSIQQVGEILDSVETPHCFIIDATKLKMKFGDMVMGGAIVTRGDSAVFKHPNLTQLVVVTTSDLIETVAKAYSQAQYGSLSVRVFGSLDEAVEYAREHV